jgi:hypothetical protein
MADAENEISKPAVHELAVHLDAMSLDLSQQLFSAEPIVRGMVEKRAIRPAAQRLSRDLFEEKAPSRSEDAADLGDRCTPVGYVMDNTEIKDGIEGFVRGWNG